MSFHNREDIYETDDVPDTNEIKQEENFEDTDVEKIHLDIKSAMRHFGNCFLDSDATDFSNGLKRVKRGYKSSEVFECGASHDNEETFDQKYHRLNREIAEMLSTYDTHRMNKENTATVATRTKLEELYSALKGAEIKLNIPCSNYSSSSTTIASSATNVSPNEKLLTLEERIRRIEGVVVGDKDPNRSGFSPLIESIENLRLQVESLSPSFLDAVSSKFQITMQGLSEINEKRSKFTNEEIDKVSHLYDFFMKQERLCENLPLVLKRVHSLHSLHEQAQQFSTKLESLFSLKQQLERKTESHEMTLFDLKKESAKAIEELTSKIQQLEKRMESL